MPGFRSIESIFDTALEVFQPDAAEDLNAVVQLNLSGDGGGNWALEIKAGRLQILPEIQENPDLTVIADAQDILEIANGDLNPALAYMVGKVHVSGDLGVLFRLQKCFEVPEGMEWLRRYV